MAADVWPAQWRPLTSDATTLVGDKECWLCLATRLLRPVTTTLQCRCNKSVQQSDATFRCNSQMRQVGTTSQCNKSVQQSDATSRYNQSVQQVGATVRRNNDSLPVTVLPVSRTFQSAIQSRVYSINDGSPFDRWPVLGWSPAMQLVEAQVTPTWAPVGEDW